MSEYQYYEFQAIDRPLDEADRQALRKVSTRAQITARSFTNTYEWGDLKADPAALVERWFDLHLYLANWGSRRLMIRLPTRLVDRHRLDAFVGATDGVLLESAGENLILDISRNEMELEDWEDGAGWLETLAPLRADVLAGDMRLFYLLWLMAVEVDDVEPDEVEPMSGLGPMTDALKGFAEFFDIDPDLVQAAAEHSAVAIQGASTSGDVQKILSALTDREKTEMLARLFEGDAHVQTELRAKVRERMAIDAPTPQAVARTVGELKDRARAIGLIRDQAVAAKQAAERQRQVEEEERERRVRLTLVARKGEAAWRDVETEIERRNSGGYDKAAGLLFDLRVIAEERGAIDDFQHRLRAIRERHARKERFIERLAALK